MAGTIYRTIEWLIFKFYVFNTESVVFTCMLTMQSITAHTYNSSSLCLSHHADKFVCEFIFRFIFTNQGHNYGCVVFFCPRDNLCVCRINNWLLKVTVIDTLFFLLLMEHYAERNKNTERHQFRIHHDQWIKLMFNHASMQIINER